MRFYVACALLGLTIFLSANAEPVPSLSPPTAISPLPVEVAATDAHIRYVGRFDRRDPAGPRCQWPASAVQVRFQGTALNARLKEIGEDRLQIVVDGQPTLVLAPDKGEGLYQLASGLPPGPHEIDVIKRTESYIGTTQFEAFQMEKSGRLLALPTRSARKIEVIGDSISCGYGNEGKNQNEHFSAATENAYQAYGAVAARTLGADYVCIAWSGCKMWPDYTIPEIYDRALPLDPGSAWDFSKWVPDAVVINLATNDFGKGNPDQAKWTGAYDTFIAHLRQVYPKAEIYCASGSMMSDAWPPGQKALSTLQAYLAQVVDDWRKAGDTRVHVIAFAPQDAAKDGIGADYHPSLKTHQLMAQTLAERLQKDLGWSQKPPTRRGKN